MRARTVALIALIPLCLILCPSQNQAADSYIMRVFQDRTNPALQYKPYFDWRIDGTCICNAACPCNFYYGYLPLDGADPFGPIQVIEQGVSSGSMISPYPDGGNFRWGRTSAVDIATNPDPRFDMQLAYFLIGPAQGGPKSCGRGGTLGDSDLNADGIPEDRGGTPVGDACEMIGRSDREQDCAQEWTREKVDGNPYSATYGMPLLMERDFRCKVIVLNLSAFW